MNGKKKNTHTHRQPATESINVCVPTQPGTRSSAPNVKCTFRNLIHSPLALATVLASYPPLYKLKPPAYIIHFMFSGDLVKTSNHPTSWDATSYGPSTIQAPSSSASKHLPKVSLSRCLQTLGHTNPLRGVLHGKPPRVSLPLSPCILMTPLYVRPTLLCTSTSRTMTSKTSTAISTPKATLTVIKI